MHAGVCYTKGTLSQGLLSDLSNGTREVSRAQLDVMRSTSHQRLGL